MATSSSTPSFGLLFSGLLVTLFVIVFSSEKSYAVREEANKETSAPSSHLYHTIQFSSLQPSTLCTAPTKEQKRRGASSLKLVHMHGPCSPVRTKAPTITEFLKRDQSRVNWIQSRIRSKTTGLHDSDSTVSIPAKFGNRLGVGNYVVTVGLGTPKRDLTLIFDTGSDLSWTQCQPCLKKCYNQQETIFDPSASTSYKNVSCDTDMCSNLQLTTNYPKSCFGPTCIYKYKYADYSFTVGFLSTDTLTLGSDVFQNFQFGCGVNNEGSFGRTAGLIALSRDPFSFVSQTSSTYGKYFSYCLPSSASYTGHLTLGKAATSPALNFTPILNDPQDTALYFISLEAISVGGDTLPISPSVFAGSGGTVIDSGTVITRLPPKAYDALRTAFRQLMPTIYPLTDGISFFDTCYDLTNFTGKSIFYPRVAFTFGGNALVEFSLREVLYPVINPSQFCLAFASNTYGFERPILGNFQQQTLEVVYDIAGGKIGFGSGGCS